MPEQPRDRSAKYSALTDHEFVTELRHHLPTRSWTLAHMLELEDRGLEITEGDAELRAALTDAYARIHAAMEPVAKALQEQFSVSLRPLQEQLSRTLKSISPQVDLAPLYEGCDIERLVSPDFSSISSGDLVGHDQATSLQTSD